MTLAESLIESLTNLVVDPLHGATLPDATFASLAAAKNGRCIPAGALIRIVLGLSALHRQLEQQAGTKLGTKLGTGNITDKSLKLNGKELILVCDLQKPSLCENTKPTDPEARRWKSFGGEPQQIDDLLSLGVALAELVIERKNLPPIDAGYRAALATKIGGVSNLNSAGRKIVKGLLQCDQNGIGDSAEFVSKYFPLLGVGKDTRLKQPSWFSFLRHSPVWALMVLAIPLLMALAFWTLWQRESVARKYAEASLAVAEGELSKIREDVIGLKGDARKYEGLWQDCVAKKPEPPSPSPLIPIGELTKLSIFQVFMDDPYIAGDNECQKILRKDNITADDWRLVRSRLGTLADAAKQWWEYVDNDYSNSVIDQQIGAISIGDPGVAGILKQWVADAAKPNTYTVTLNENSTAAEGYLKYWFRLTINQEILKPATSADSLDIIFDHDNATRDVGISWAAGQPIDLLFESWSYKNLVWNNLFQDQLSGYLAIHKLASGEFGNKMGFKLRFVVSPLPGPTLASRSKSLDIPSVPPVESSAPAPTIQNKPPKEPIEVTLDGLL